MWLGDEGDGWFGIGVRSDQKSQDMSLVEDTGCYFRRKSDIR